MAYVRPVKILFLHPTYVFGGAERTAYNLLSNLDPELFRITYVTSKEVYQRFAHLPLSEVMFLEDIGIRNVWFGDFRSILKDSKVVAGILKREKFDIAFGMMHYAALLLALAKIMCRPKTKIISSPRGPSSAYLKRFIKGAGERMYLKFLFSLFCRFSDGLIVASQGVKNDCVVNYGARAKTVCVIPNSVDMEDIRDKARELVDFPLPSGVPVISAAGRLSAEKNLPFLIRAFSEVRRKRRLKLLIIGGGPERENLQALVSGLKMEDDVHFLGHQKNPYKYIAASDIFVHTCLVEGFGNAIIEAMACRVPVIATACPYGPGEIIKSGENGILVPMDDPDALSEGILSLLADEGLRSNLAAKGYLRASEFSVDRMVKAYGNFFLEMTGGDSSIPSSSG